MILPLCISLRAADSGRNRTTRSRDRLGRSRWLAMGALLGALGASEVLAQSASVSDADGQPKRPVEEMVVRGRHIHRALAADRSDASVVISREEIEVSQQPLLIDVLRGKAGLTVQSAGGPGKSTDLRVRGSGNDQVQVIIDGVRVGSATTGSFNFANLPSATIERVEILRGPQSTIFGASAVGGVVLIETRQGSGPLSLEAEGGYGSDEQSLLSARVSGGTDSGARYSVAALRTTIDGVSATEVLRPGETELEDDPFRNLQIAANGTLPLADGRLRLGARFTDSAVNLDDRDEDNPFFEQDTRELQLDMGLEYPILENWSTRAVVARYNLRREGSDLPGSDNNFDIESTSWQASWLHEIDLHGFGVLGGIDFESERGENPDADFDRSVEQTGVFAKVESPSAWPLSLNGGFRFEANSISRDRVTYQIGTTVQLGSLLTRLAPEMSLLEGLALRANYGTAFRPPTLNDLFFAVPGFAIANPDLRPETSEGFDAGLAYGRVLPHEIEVSLDFWGFYQDYEDLIEFRGFPLQPVNVSKAEIWGLEASGEIRWRWISLAASWTHLQSEDGDGFQLQRRPENAGEVRLSAEVGPVLGQLSVRAVGKSFSRSRERDEVDSFAVVDLSARYALSERISIRGRIRNLLDEDYQEILNRGTLGRTLFLSVAIEI